MTATAAFMVAAPTSAALRALNYNPIVDRLRHGSSEIGTLCSVTESVGDIFTSLPCDPGCGVQVLAQADTFSAEPSGKWIRPESFRKTSDHELRRWQIAIAGAGQMGEGNLFGRSVLIDARFEGLYIASDSVVLEFEQPGGDLNLWTYAYLNSYAGLAALRACAYGTSIPRLRLDLLSRVPVPMPGVERVERVARLLRSAVDHRERYADELAKARDVVNLLPVVREASRLSKQQQKTVLWSGELPTLRAWNYASMGSALELLRRQWSGRLADAVQEDGIFKGGRLTRVPCTRPLGVDLLSQRDVFAMRPFPRRIQRPAGAGLEVDATMLLLASRGQMNEGALFGRVERAVHLPADAIVTEDITRLRPKASLESGLYAFLSTPLGLALLRSTAYGTSIPGMRVDLLEGLPIPDESVMSKAAHHTERATEARLQATMDEGAALRIVEEEVLPEWLD